MSGGKEGAVEAAIFEERESQTFLGEPFVTMRPSGAAAPAAGPPNAPPLRITGLNHVAVEAQDVERLCEFYTRVLGLHPLPRPGFPFDGCWLAGPGLVLHIIQKDPSVARNVTDWRESYEAEPEAWMIRRGSHIALAVDSAERAEHILQQHRVEYSRFTLPDSDLCQIFLFDPEGHGIELGVYR